ncbi:hypothetical protein TRICHSKD4_0188 [Roseibium sp. TrichSKD4]|nr:hypothetical protein TRICHSKD4_0188 [Roseibium sp. TrichSKD4]
MRFECKADGTLKMAEAGTCYKSNLQRLSMVGKLKMFHFEL